jgi:hypothetical protein
MGDDIDSAKFRPNDAAFNNHSAVLSPIFLVGAAGFIARGD